MFFFIAENASFQWVVCRSEFWHLRRKPSLIFSKWIFFQNSLKLSWDIYSGKVQVKHKYNFLNFSLIKKLWNRLYLLNRNGVYVRLSSFKCEKLVIKNMPFCRLTIHLYIFLNSKRNTLKTWLCCLNFSAP